MFMERLYRTSPVVVQNAMLSLYGGLLYWRRLASPAHDRLVREIADLESMRAGETELYQLEQARRLLVAVRETVPYYRELFDHLGFHPGELRNMEDFRQIPTMEKWQLQRSPNLYLSGGRSRGYVTNTSGSTGTPLKIYCDRDALTRSYAHFFRLRQRIGVFDKRARCATFAGRAICEPDRRVPPFWRRNAVANVTLFSTYHMGPLTLPHYVRELARMEPMLIDSYPSALGLIAVAALNEPRRLIRPTAVITSSETLLESQRNVAEAAFQCRVTDQYGGAEMAAFIAQCDQGSYHVWPSYGIAEVLVGDRPALPGETGELICTGFVNRVMPLVRYRTGDLATVATRPCACGLAFPAITSIEGRRDDLIVCPDGRRVGRLDPVFKGLPVGCLVESQIVQRELHHVELRYVPGREFSMEAITQVVQALRERLGSTVEVTTAAMETIPRGRNGKFRSVVCEVPDLSESVAVTGGEAQVG